ncbi:MAG: tyrosine-type recombinase/integrase [Ignavibacteriaceae bacterium]
MSTIKKLSNGNYRVQVYDQFGKRHRHTFNKKFESDAYLRKIESEKNDDRLVRAKLVKSRVLFDKAFADFWSTKIGLSQRTVQKYKAELEQINNFRISQNLEYVDQFERLHADTFKSMLVKSGAAPKTINSYLMRLKSIFREEVNRDSIIRDPTSHIVSVPRTRKTMLQREDEYYTGDEVKVIFSQQIDPAYRTALIGLYLTGMRFEELANLTWEGLDFVNRMIMVRSIGEFTTKTPTSERDIPMSDMLYSILEGSAGNSNSGYVFPSKSGSKLSERTLLTVCKRTANRAGIKKTATLHKFRHTFTSLLSQMGVAYEVREYLLGHKPTGSLTGHYTKLNPKKYHSIVGLLDKVLEGSDDNKGT